MGFRFQRHVNAGLGRINISKSGISLSEGIRGAHITIGRTPRITLGIPGTGCRGPRRWRAVGAGRRLLSPYRAGLC